MVISIVVNISMIGYMAFMVQPTIAIIHVVRVERNRC